MRGRPLGTIAAAAALKVPVAIDAFVGAVENMTGGNAYKLGDILTYNNGVSVEIHNTDAEGRLVLADCLIQACKVPNVAHIVDMATLTGAVVVAIGPDYTGLFTQDKALSEALHNAANTTGEGLWSLPLHTPYNRMLKGTWSKIKNVGERSAGSITAALFLNHFVDENISWAHLDIAGSAFYETPIAGYAPGGTGQMVRTLVEWTKSLN